MQPYHIHAPVLQVIEVMISETVVSVEGVKIRVKWVDLVNSVDPMVDSVAIILINEHGVVGVDSD